MARVLVTDGEQRSALAAVRSLGRAGHEVLVSAVLERPLAAASRFCRGSFVVPDPLVDLPTSSNGLEAIVDAEGIEVVLPMTDSSAMVVAGLRRSRSSLVVAFPEDEAYELASDKRRLLDLAATLGVPVPRQVLRERPEPGAAGALAAAGIDYPVVLKPARSVVRSGGRLSKTRVRFVANEAELEPALASYPAEAYPILVQERVLGEGLGAFVLADRGRVLAAFGHRRIREKPPTGGVSVYRESVSLRDDVRHSTERLIEALEWSGVAMIEFKEHAATGTPYLMEVNGRFWGSLQLAVDAGVDFPVLLLQLVLGEEVESVPSYRLGLRSRWLLGDLDHLLWILRTPRHERARHPFLPGRLRALGRFLVPWRPGDRWEVLRLGDPVPFLRESRRWMSDLVRKGRSRSEPRAAP